MKWKSLIATSLLILVPFANAEEEPKKVFVKLEEAEKQAALQTIVLHFKKESVEVDLFGAIHIADKTYYEELNQRFKEYDVVLFELVGGEAYGNGKGLPKERDDKRADDPMLDMIRASFNGMAKQMKMSMQVEEIDYGAKNFLHADITTEQFAEIQKDFGSDMMMFALAETAQLMKSGQDNQLGNVLGAMLSGNPNYLKLQYGKLLATMGGDVSDEANKTIILGKRNDAALKVLDAQLEKKQLKIAIFYGAAHLEGLEENIVKRGFVKEKEEWLTAWEIEK